MAKEPLELKWIESLLPEDGYRRKSMFGGFAYYIEEKIILLMFENPGDRKYGKKTFDFELWNGCMFPVEHELQAQARAQFPFLFPHPILAKWLYLPLETEGFEDLVTQILHQAARPHSFWGSYPKGKRKEPRALNLDKISVKIDTRRPRLFSDEPAQEALEKAHKISDLKNLGAVAEREFTSAGIKTAAQFIKLGWKKSLLKLISVNPKNRHSLYAYALIGALQNKDWNGLSESDKKEAQEFVRSLPRTLKNPKQKTVKKKASLSPTKKPKTAAKKAPTRKR